MESPSSVVDAIFVDEIGLEYGRYGDFVLKCGYQQVFRRQGGNLLPCGIEGVPLAWCEGRAVARAELAALTAPGDEVFVECMFRALYLRNFRHAGADGLTLFFSLDARADGGFLDMVEELDAAAERLGEMEIDRGNLVCLLADTARQDAVTLVKIAAELRRHGIRLAVDDFGIGPTNLDRVELLRPDIVRVSGRWFRQLAAVPGAALLFRSLVAGLSERGAAVMVDGIAARRELACAAAGDALFLEGSLLSEPRLAGAVIETEPVELAGLLGDEANVVRLFN